MIRFSDLSVGERFRFVYGWPPRDPSERVFIKTSRTGYRDPITWHTYRTGVAVTVTTQNTKERSANGTLQR